MTADPEKWKHFERLVAAIHRAKDQGAKPDMDYADKAIAELAGLIVTIGGANENYFRASEIDDNIRARFEQIGSTFLKNDLNPSDQATVSTLLADAKRAAEKVIAMKEREGDKPQNQENLYLIVPTQVTRFGTLLIVIFLVNILVNLYRYNVRLSAYYDARGDAVTMLGIASGYPADTEDFAKLVKELSPEAYDFGKMPRSPVDHAVDLAKEVIAKLPVKTT